MLKILNGSPGFGEAFSEKAMKDFLTTKNQKVSLLPDESDDNGVISKLLCRDSDYLYDLIGLRIYKQLCKFRRAEHSTTLFII